jgi:hypothetical protein
MKILSHQLIIVALLYSCRNEAPFLPEVVGSWRDYFNEKDGYALKVPQYFVISEHDNGVLFRYDGYPSIAVTCTSVDEAKGRGLWAQFVPMAEIQMNGKSWKKYIYDPYDEPFYMRVVSFVTELNDKFLAVAFRMCTMK